MADVSPTTETAATSAPVKLNVIQSKTPTATVVNNEINIIDSNWISSRFMTPSNKLDKLDATNRFFTTTSLKFTDTTLGGNIGINPRPQFTRYCDIKGNGRVLKTPVTIPANKGNHGMGRYYSEAIDDNAQMVFLEFGIPKFNSLIDFFTRAVDYEDSVVANTGRLPVGYKLGQFLGAGVMLAAFPLITLSIWAIKLINKMMVGVGNFDYYYLEPTMHMYWASVNHIVTNLATEMGILIPELMQEGTEANKIGIPVKINQDDMNELKKIFPNLISDNNYIDVFAIATRAQSIANRQMLRDREIYKKNEMSTFDFVGYVKTKTSVTESNAAGSGIWNALNETFMFSKYLSGEKGDSGVTKGNGLFSNRDGAQTATTAPDIAPDTKFIKNPDGTYPDTPTPEKQTYVDRFVTALDSSVRDGGLHAAFYVDYTGSVSESFSNSVGNINTSDAIKSLSSGARNIKFDLAGGNITAGAQEILQAGKDFLAGALDGISLGLSSVIQTITGGGYVDMPKKWEDSDMNLPTVTYNMQLISPYGNTISQLQNIYIPLSMILAGVLPLAAGKSSYTSPFICSLFSKGVQKVKMGMITNVSITRGTSNLGFNKSRRPLAIDVSFTVTDFSTRMTAPVSTSMFDIFNVSLHDDTPLANYLSTLGSRDLLTNKYTLPKVMLRASRLLMNKDQAISPSAWGLRTGESLNFVLGGLVADQSLTLAQSN